MQRSPQESSAISENPGKKYYFSNDWNRGYPRVEILRFKVTQEYVAHPDANNWMRLAAASKVLDASRNNWFCGATRT